MTDTMVLSIFFGYQYTLCAGLTAYCIHQYFHESLTLCNWVLVVIGGLFWWFALPLMFYRLIRKGS